MRAYHLHTPLALAQVETEACYNGYTLGDLQYWSNWSFQYFTGLFSYLNGLTIPWRLSIVCHLLNLFPSQKKQSFSVGTDFYGRPTDAIWFHIPHKPRIMIASLLLTSAVTHFISQVSPLSACNMHYLPSVLLLLLTSTVTTLISQATRIVYDTYDKTKDSPGSIAVNIPFFLSVLTAIAAGCVSPDMQMEDYPFPTHLHGSSFVTQVRTGLE